ncbi:hypothetical protein D9758_011572 [Tetrapyrgos nigripes]|uniref:Uncharacterized protein n=1 Tax=Tetrapyrgos nigripes TaxID=182062 RepID=A0A8H5CPY5_9AGAR|nr:hypothetical protein D9758_011572 [Tetrapyrgos nigripes]
MSVDYDDSKITNDADEDAFAEDDRKTEDIEKLAGKLIDIVGKEIGKEKLMEVLSCLMKW